MCHKFFKILLCFCCALSLFNFTGNAQANSNLSQFIYEYQYFMQQKGFASSTRYTQRKTPISQFIDEYTHFMQSGASLSHSAQSTVGNHLLESMNPNTIGLSKADAQRITEELLAKRKHNTLQTFGSEWDARRLSYKGYSMPFDIKIFGKAPASGRSMYISLHGGGGTEAHINDQQWENQKRLYTLPEGVYFVPRSPTNTWNMWHQEYMDAFIQNAIELAVIKEGVNPNEVYIMGYSAGGDGVYQLATRMPDLFAAAAMSAGHPGDAHIENLMNLPFGLYMGGQDSAYDRNAHAHTWKNKLAKLAKDSQGSYVHDVHIFPQFGHWMEKHDAISISFMSQYARNPIPYEVYWIQDDVLRDHFYWLSTVPKSKHQNAAIKVFYNDDESLFYIENETNVQNFIININDAMCDLDKKITIYRNDRIIFEGYIPRSAENIKKDIEAGRDANLIFPAKVFIKGMKAQVIGL